MTDSPRPTGPQEPGDVGGRPGVPPGWSPEQPPPAPGWGSPGAGSPGAAAPSAPTAPTPPPGPPGPTGGPWGQPAWQGGWAPPAPKPGIIPLRPLGVGELLDGAISTLRSHPRTVLGLSAVVALVTQLVSVPLTWLLLGDLDADLGAVGWTSGASLVVTVLATTFLTGVLTVVVSRAVLGEDVPMAQAWQRARPRLAALLGVTLLSMLAPVLAFALPLLPALALGLGDAGEGPLVTAVALGALTGIVLATWVYVRIALAAPAVVLEGSAPLPALRRSARLVQGAWWRTFGVLLLVNVVAGILSSILSVPFTIGGGFLSSDPADLGPLTLAAVGTILAAAVTWPFTAAATVLLYVDRRMRREGLDLELARAAGRTGAGPGGGAAPGPQGAQPGPGW